MTDDQDGIESWKRPDERCHVVVWVDSFHRLNPLLRAQGFGQDLRRLPGPLLAAMENAFRAYLKIGGLSGKETVPSGVPSRNQRGWGGDSQIP